MASLWITLRRESCGQMPGKVVTASLWSLRNPHSSMQKCELLCKWNVVMDMKSPGQAHVQCVHLFNS